MSKQVLDLRSRAWRFIAAETMSVGVVGLVAAGLLLSGVGSQIEAMGVYDLATGVAVGTSVRYALHARWVFRDRGLPSTRTLLPYLVLSVLIGLLDLVVIRHLATTRGLNLGLAAVLAVPCVALLRLHMVNAWVFGSDPSRPGRRVLFRARNAQASIGRVTGPAAIAAIVLVVGLLVVPASRPMPTASTTPNAPTLAQINASIAAAQGFLDGLYRPVGSGEAVQAEYYGLPLRVRFTSDGEWVLLGDGMAGECLPRCAATTSISTVAVDRTSETSRITFSHGSVSDALTLVLRLDWSHAGQTLVRMVQSQRNDLSSDAEIFLGSTHLSTVTRSSRGVGEWAIPDADRNQFASWRYSVRHATQQAYMYWSARSARGEAGAEAHADALARFLTANGFTPGFDIRAPVFGLGQGHPNGMVFEEAGYPDCEHLPQATEIAYPYRSKLCLLGGSPVASLGSTDPYLPALFALQTLTNSHSPGSRYRLPEMALADSATPQGTADHLQRLWITNQGMPRCNPIECDNDSSSFRTAIFGALETQLGYQYGQQSRIAYADAAAAQLISHQVGANGLLRTPLGDLQRPTQSGAFPQYWDASRRVDLPPTLVERIGYRLSMPAEFAGTIVGNSETTFDVWAFLTSYRCLRFHVGCPTEEK